MPEAEIAQLVEGAVPTVPQYAIVATPEEPNLVTSTADVAFVDLINLAEKSGWRVHVNLFYSRDDSAKVNLWGILRPGVEPGVDVLHWTLECTQGGCMTVVADQIVSINIALDLELEDQREQHTSAPVLRIYCCIT